MEAELAPFASFYESFFQHPVLLWAAAVAALAFCGTRGGISRDVRVFTTALGVLSLCDAWLTSNHVVGLGSLPDALASAVPLCFVLLGDFRFFLLVESATRDGRLEFRAKATAMAAGMTAVVPLLTQIAMTWVPESADSPRVMFLIYEVAFFILTLGLIRWHARIASNSWLRSVSRFVALYYGLWAIADAAILFADSDLGYLLRALPNVLYYGGLIAVIAATAPRKSN